MKARLLPLQIQKHILAPLLQQSISVLLLPLMDLTAAIEQELQLNPLLEVDESTKIISEIQKTEKIHYNIEQLTKLYGETKDTAVNDEDDFHGNQLVAKSLTLEEYLLRQLRIEVSDPVSLKVGEIIIGNINEDGYLQVTCQEIAQTTTLDELSTVENVLKIVQGFDPPGIAARDLKECLTNQLQFRQHAISEPVYEIINNYLESLGHRKYQDIARKIGIPFEEVKKAAQLIATLEPKPARNYQSINNTIYIQPDVSIKKDEELGYQVVINEEGIPRLRISSFYKELLNRPNLKEDERNFIQEKLENALYFIKSIEQRGHTIREITKYVIEKQQAFLNGDDFSIAPMTLKEVALAIHRNESTISRAISNKYVDTPAGLLPLKYFFSQAVPTDNNGQTSSRGIKEEIKAMIVEENKSS